MRALLIYWVSYGTIRDSDCLAKEQREVSFAVLWQHDSGWNVVVATFDSMPSACQNTPCVCTGKEGNKRRTIIFLWGGGGGGWAAFFIKKLFASRSWLKKLSASRLWTKKLSANQQETFWNTLIFQNFDTDWTRHKSIFQFHLIY